MRPSRCACSLPLALQSCLRRLDLYATPSLPSSSDITCSLFVAARARGTTRARPRHAPATTRPGHAKFRTWGWENSGQGSAGQEQQNNGQGSKTDHGFRAHRAARKSEAKARPPCHGPARRRGSVVGIPMHERNVASPVRSIAGRTAQHLSSSTWTCDMTRAWTWIWGLTPTKPVFAKGVAATGVVQPVQSACSPCYLVCIVASRGDVREGFEGLREEADLESLGAMPKYSAGRATTRSGMTKHILRRDLAHRARLIEHGTDQERPATAHLSKRRCQLSVCRSDEVEAPDARSFGFPEGSVAIATGYPTGKR